MAIRRKIEVSCDVENCAHRFTREWDRVPGQKAKGDPSQARHEARRLFDWVHEEGADFCPSHAVDRRPVAMAEGPGDVA